MNPFRRVVTIGHNAREFVQNRRPTEREDMVKQQSESNMQHDARYWGQVRCNLSAGCHLRLWRSTSTLTERFCPDRKVFCWCRWMFRFIWIQPHQLLALANNGMESQYSCNLKFSFNSCFQWNGQPNTTFSHITIELRNIPKHLKLSITLLLYNGLALSIQISNEAWWISHHHSSSLSHHFKLPWVRS
jgi:hypothetical protein